MVPLVVLVVGFAVFRTVGVWVAFLADWQHALRAALGVMFLVTASAHWGRGRADLVRMVPKRIGHAEFWVTFTGISELAIAVGLQIPSVAVWCAVVAVLMLVCLLPANLKAAREHLTLLGRPVWSAVPRTALQIFFASALIASVWR